MHIRRNDVVEIVTGAEKGRRGRVLQVMESKNKVVVEGVRQVWKHVRPSQKNQRGGRIQIELPIDASNVMLTCPNRECKRFEKTVRVASKTGGDGSKQRVCRVCGAEIPKVL
ncbi:MAG TPA: 50S ribosomal protein L24 [Candidatus Brocadiia bacterium]|nr:50S ribosomal protein L24 [Candidatus Brocadiia bacterium]